MKEKKGLPSGSSKSVKLKGSEVPEVCSECGKPTKEGDPKLYKQFLVDRASRAIYEASSQLKGLGEEAALARAMVGNTVNEIHRNQEMLEELRSQLTLGPKDSGEDAKSKLMLIVDIGRTLTKIDKLHDRLNNTLDLIGRLVERDQKIKEGLKLVVDIRTIVLLMRHMTGIINSICRDCDKRDAIAEEIGKVDILGEAISCESMGVEE